MRGPLVDCARAAIDQSKATAKVENVTIKRLRMNTTRIFITSLKCPDSTASENRVLSRRNRDADSRLSFLGRITNCVTCQRRQSRQSSEQEEKLWPKSK